ncbi:hypothetical protein [uncultured Algibacter sp.]|uniref:hypothetical protein n=1 Tax=uncultured Algibacter sp. TaxID=298659 RepID=UPI002609FE94|nr:hypothetical protein [uncultured Algibacter sp.]
MDKFEKYIRENSNAFDIHKPNKDKLWANIEAKLEKQDTKPKVIRLWNRTAFKVAASIVLAFGLFTAVNIMTSNSNSKSNYFVSQELEDIDSHYSGLVAYQVKLINNTPKLTNEEKKDFLSFMDDLDAEYEILKEELKKNIDNERVLEAIVINYKKRIELIENLLNQINSSNKTNDEDVYIL